MVGSTYRDPTEHATGVKRRQQSATEWQSGFSLFSLVILLTLSPSLDQPLSKNASYNHNCSPIRA